MFLLLWVIFSCLFACQVIFYWWPDMVNSEVWGTIQDLHLLGRARAAGLPNVIFSQTHANRDTLQISRTLSRQLLSFHTAPFSPALFPGNSSYLDWPPILCSASLIKRPLILLVSLSPLHRSHKLFPDSWGIHRTHLIPYFHTNFVWPVFHYLENTVSNSLSNFWLCFLRWECKSLSSSSMMSRSLPGVFLLQNSVLGFRLLRRGRCPAGIGISVEMLFQRVWGK